MFAPAWQVNTGRNSIASGVWYWLFVFLQFILMFNMVVGILFDAYAQVTHPRTHPTLTRLVASRPQSFLLAGCTFVGDSSRLLLSCAHCLRRALGLAVAVAALRAPGSETVGGSGEKPFLGKALSGDDR